ncbi:MAG: AraC family transcriptional regulator [Fimbriimonadaceae bacterium]|nr:AraC family transcriptional regulator [Fimbriimonadaceae bacterium]
MRVQTRHLHLVSVYRIIEYILSSEQGAIRLPELSRIGGLSRFHLTRVFQSLTGESLAEFVRRIRLEQSAHRLLTTCASITDLARSAGYSNGEAFTRAFRGHYGLAPTDFRRERRHDWRTPVPSNLHWTDGPICFRPHVLEQNGPEVEVVGRPELHLAAFRHVGPYRKSVEMWPKIREAVEAHGLVTPESRWYSVFHDDHARVPHERCRADLAVTWPRDAELPVGAHHLVLPAAVYVATREERGIEEHSETWAALTRDWLPRSGQRPINVPCLNEYRSCPAPWEEARLKMLIGLEVDLGRP